MNGVFTESISLLVRQSVVYVTSIDENNFPCCKALYKPWFIEGLSYFYFSSDINSQHVQQYIKNESGCIYFHDEEKGVMLKGKMIITQDIQIKKKIWRDTDIKYYPLGVSDPNYCVMKFVAESGRYYFNLESFNFIVAS